MKHTLIVGFILILFHFNSQAQTPNDLIDLQQPNYELLERLILDEVNELRKKKRRAPLAVEGNLEKAATDHNNWLKGRKKLTHNEPDRRRKRPYDRVKIYSDDFIKVGENVQYLGLSYEQQGRRKWPNTITYKAAAKKAFKNWKNSPGHYKNLISKEFNKVGTAVVYDAKNFRFYATQVYGWR